MALTRATLPSRGIRPPGGWPGVAGALATALAAAAAALIAALAMLPLPLAFAVLAAGLVLAAAALALIAFAAPAETGRARTFYWDVAGLLTLIALAAALFGEPEQAAALLSRKEA
jgi:hypothetical protein